MVNKKMKEKKEKRECKMANCWIKLFVAVFAVLLIGYMGSFFTSQSVNTWYSLLEKPSFNPPNWIFGPVWTILYILIGISFWLVWTNKENLSKKEDFYKIFAIQLVLNFLWSILFFGNQNIMLALIEIVLLWFSILFCIIYAWKISKPASLLLLPYIVWVSFAAVLNLSLLMLN